ncbi:hypothetical protein [Flagellimonas nanhaiensis]|nr:hypothetical protein [Allomuricauda nanhaiensis]
MPIITEEIPKQGFEIVGEQIGAILTMELAYQRTLKSLSDNFESFYERKTPYDKSEGVMVSVLYDNTNYDNRTQSNSNGPSTFHIDVYGSSPSKPNERGDGLAAALVKQYLGMIRYILSSTKYKSLLLPPNTIGGTYVDSIQMYDTENNQDAKNIRMGRIAFVVKLYETQALWEATVLTGNVTGVKLEDADSGYKYELTN